MRPKKRVLKGKLKERASEIMWCYDLFNCLQKWTTCAFRAKWGAAVMLYSPPTLLIICCHPGTSFLQAASSVHTHTACSGRYSLHSRSEGNDRITVCSAVLNRCSVTATAGTCQGQKPVSGVSWISPLHSKKFQLHGSTALLFLWIPDQHLMSLNETW